VGCCIHGNEPSGFTKDSGFLNWLSDSTLQDFVLKLGRVVSLNTPQFYELKNPHFWFWCMRTSHPATPSFCVLLRLTVMTCLKQNTLLTVSVCSPCGRQWLLKAVAASSRYLLAHPLNVRVRLMPGMPYLQRTGMPALCGVQTACVQQDTTRVFALTWNVLWSFELEFLVLFFCPHLSA